MDRVLCQGFAFDLPGFYDSGFLKVCALGESHCRQQGVGGRHLTTLYFSLLFKKQMLIEHQLCAKKGLCVVQ